MENQSNIKYSVLYDVDLRFLINQTENIQISPADIVSISIQNQYDACTYPMFRLRLYCDLKILQSLTDHPDDIEIRGTLRGGIYKMGDDESSTILLKPTGVIPITLKGYIEFKNTPTSRMDQYVNGKPISKDNTLYANNKVPVEVYGYNSDMIHRMRDQSPAIYHNMTLSSVVDSMLSHCNIQKKHVDPFHNQIKMNQILIPNLSMIESLSYFDATYGLYPKGGMVYGALDQMYICNTDSNNGTVPLPIYVHSFRNNSDMSGMMKISNQYFMQTEFASVSIISESDIEKVLQSERITSVNVNTLHVTEEDLPFYAESETQQNQSLVTKTAHGNISPQIMLHKTPNHYFASMTAARINEKITKVDVSGVGFDIAKMTPITRYNLIFESPIRGIHMADMYRASTVTHVLNCVGKTLFSTTTTMTLCRN